jgi:integrase
MSLEIKFGKSRWWYGRVTVRGRVLCKNLGVEIAGNPPARLSEVGDIVFERSRSKAQAALERFQVEIRKRSAAEELVQTIHEIRTGERIRSIELKDIAARWKDLPRRRPLSKSYLMQADSRLRRFIDFLNSRFRAVREMADVQPYMARDFMKSETARGIATKTYNANLIFLRSCFEQLKDEAGIAKNPFAHMPTLESTPVFRHAFSTQELERIVEAAKDDPFIYPIIVTGMCTAMRRADCCLLRKDSVDLANRFITVKTSKTGQTVQIPIFPLLYDVLSKIDFKEDASPYVFRVQAYKFMAYPDVITYHVRDVLRKVGFFNPEDAETEEEKQKSLGEVSRARTDGIRRASVRDFHSFRVSWVTLALTAGVPMEIVQRVTGHKTADIVVKHYFQPKREEFRRLLASKLPGVIGDPSAHEKPAAKENALRAQLANMAPGSWESVRDKLLDILDEEKKLADAKLVSEPLTPFLMG